MLTNKTYDSFKKGLIAHPITKRHTERIGETRMQNCGMKATITAYETGKNITVRFTDGTEITNRCYGEFTKGSIMHPDIKRYMYQEIREKIRKNRIGEIRMQNCGLKAMIIEYEKNEDMTILFSDGTQVEHKVYSSFKKGCIGHPTISRRFQTSIGKIHPQSKSKIYHTRIFGITHKDEPGNYYYIATQLMQTNVLCGNELKIRVQKASSKEPNIRIDILQCNGNIRSENICYAEDMKHPIVRCIEDDFCISLIKE